MYPTRTLFLLLCLTLALGPGAAAQEEGRAPLAQRLAALDAIHPGAAAFVEEVSTEHGLDPAWLVATLTRAERQERILEAMRRPAEAKPWYEYRQIFMTDSRIAGGRAFLQEHATLLGELEERFGVPPEMVSAIIGVETRYGQITGSYRVLDALATLAFHYPPRAKFFRRELEQLVLLSQEEDVPLAAVQGSYAGAMGMGQFIPSSYRAYAVDFDGDGRRDLWHSPDDAIASVANYFAAHRWRRGEPVVVRARVSAEARKLEDLPLKPQYPVEQLLAWGYEPLTPVPAQTLSTVIELEGADGPEYWIGFQNFYVITRYNRSPLYAMAVHQLAEALAAPSSGVASAAATDAP